MIRLLLGCVLAGWLLLHWAPVERRMDRTAQELGQFAAAWHNISEGL